MIKDTLTQRDVRIKCWDRSTGGWVDRVVPGIGYGHLTINLDPARGHYNLTLHASGIKLFSVSSEKVARRLLWQLDPLDPFWRIDQSASREDLARAWDRIQTALYRIGI